MKKQIRPCMFETNSSSTHSLSLCSADDFERWKLGRLFFNAEADAFYTKGEVIQNLKDIFWDCVVDWDDEQEINKLIDSSEIFYTYEKFFNQCYYETFLEEKAFDETSVVAFGYYGYDG